MVMGWLGVSIVLVEKKLDSQSKVHVARRTTLIMSVCRIIRYSRYLDVVRRTIGYRRLLDDLPGRALTALAFSFASPCGRGRAVQRGRKRGDPL